MAGVTTTNLHKVFTFHTPADQATVDKYTAIREAAEHFAEVILVNTPTCGDQQAAIRKVREAAHTANAAVALAGEV